MTTKLERTVERALIESDVVAEIFVRLEDGTVVLQKKNICGWGAIRPDIGRTEQVIGPRVANNLIVKVKIENGEIHELDIGGWYVGPPKPLGRHSIEGTGERKITSR